MSCYRLAWQYTTFILYFNYHNKHYDAWLITLLTICMATITPKYLRADYFFSYPIPGGWKIFKALQGLFVLGAPNLLCRSGVRWWGSQAIFCLKTINDQSYKLKNSWCHNDLFHAFVFSFTFKLYVCHTGSSFHSNIEKCFYYCLIITLWKCEQYLIWTLKKSILFSSNSLEMSVLCGKFLL